MSLTSILLHRQNCTCPVGFSCFELVAISFFFFLLFWRFVGFTGTFGTLVGTVGTFVALFNAEIDHMSILLKILHL
jgi:hypothetical protein